MTLFDVIRERRSLWDVIFRLRMMRYADIINSWSSKASNG